MKIRLLTSQHLLVPAGTEIDVDDGRAALLISIGAAEQAGAVKAVEKAVKKPTETAKKTTATKKG